MEFRTGFSVSQGVSEMLELLDYGFMRNALLLSILASVSCGVTGSLITVNRMSSFAGSIAHASFGGLGLAYLLGIDPMIGATVFALGSGLGTGYLSGGKKMGSNTAMAALWATGMASGLVFIKLSGTYTADLMSWLFGSLMSVSRNDIILTGVLGIASVLVVTLFYREFLGISYDMEFTRLQGVPVELVKGLFLILSALTVIVLMKVAGLIMVIALLTLPATIAGYFSRSLRQMMLFAGLLSMVFSIAGLFLSWKLDLPPGPVIILIAAFAYFTVAGFMRRKG
jgi:zinc transport system permease protein